LVKIWKREKASKDVMGVVAHLSELRKRLIIICAFFIVAV